MSKRDRFSFRYYVGHEGKFGHEFLEFEFNSKGRLRYANNSNYKNDKIIRKEAYVSKSVLNELKRIIEESEICKESDKLWPAPDKVGKQELEIFLDGNEYYFTTSKIGSLSDLKQCEDPEGLRVFYYLVQDLKCFLFSLICLHFRVSVEAQGGNNYIKCVYTLEKILMWFSPFPQMEFAVPLYSPVLWLKRTYMFFPVFRLSLCEVIPKILSLSPAYQHNGVLC